MTKIGKNRIDLTGQKFGKLLIVSFSDKRGKHLYWNYICDCGKKGKMATTALLDRERKSCGCTIQEHYATLKGKPKSHGQTINGVWTDTYRIYRAVIARCENPNVVAYPDYGGRGIKICDRWRNGEDGKTGFICFKEDMGERPPKLSLDRINNEGNYEPENCRWATAKTQGRNTRSVKLNPESAKEIKERVYAGEPRKQIAEELGISLTTVRDVLSGKTWG